MSAAALDETASLWDDDYGLTPEEIQLREDAAVLWREGELSWKLDPHQKRAYDAYRAWENNAPANDNGEFSRIFIMDIARRWGKTMLCLVIVLEDCIRRKGSRITYATAFQKDIADIVIPLLEDILVDCPADMRPVFRGGKSGETMGYFFPTTLDKKGIKRGSRIKLVGIDKNPNGLRGRASDGFVISEAGFVANLERAIRRVIYPQFQRRNHARMILESNAPEDPEHEYDTVFIPDAEKRGAVYSRTIDDNEAIDEKEKEEFLRAAGGKDSPTAQREYFQKRNRDKQRVVVPEFDIKRHVGIIKRPAYARCFVSMDPGLKDLCAILWAYWHFEEAKLVVELDWAEQNASQTVIAKTIRVGETLLWGIDHSEPKKTRPEDVIYELHESPSEIPKGFHFFDGSSPRANPFMRVTDTEPRLLYELPREHGLRVLPADKSEGARRELAKSEPAIHSLRGAFIRDNIIIHPRCLTLISHLEYARWNKKRTDYDRTNPKFGHFDCLDALVYMWRALQPYRKLNPTPPKWYGKHSSAIMMRPEHSEKDARRSRVIAGIIGGRNKRTNPRRKRFFKRRMAA